MIFSTSFVVPGFPREMEVDTEVGVRNFSRFDIARTRFRMIDSRSRIWKEPFVSTTAALARGLRLDMLVCVFGTFESVEEWS